MPRAANVYGPRTSKEVAREVKNFNARRREAIRRDPEAENWLPDKASVKRFKAENTSRADVNAGLKELRAFRADKMAPVYLDKGLIRTQWEIDVVARQVKEVNRSRKRRLREIQPSKERGTASAAEQLNLQPMKFDPNAIKPEDWQRKRTAALRESRRNFDENQRREYKRQYLQNIQDLNLDKDKERKIMALIRDLPPSAFIQGYKLDPVLNIKFTSDPLHKDRIAGEIYRHWQEFLGQPGDDENMAWDEDEDNED